MEAGEILGKNSNKEYNTGGNEKNMKGLDYTVLVIGIIGALNWGLIGLFRFDLVAFLFGNMSWLSRVIYTLVGFAGLYHCTFFGRLGNGTQN